MNKIVKNNVSEMGMTDLLLNQVFVKNGEAWYRDFDREISVLNLIREICTKHKCPADANEMDDETLDEILRVNLQYGTDSLEGIIAMYYTALVGMAEVRAHLEVYENPELLEVRQMKKLSEYSTRELVEELEKREGVDKKIAEPYKDCEVSVNGPAVILIVTD